MEFCVCAHCLKADRYVVWTWTGFGRGSWLHSWCVRLPKRGRINL